MAKFNLFSFLEKKIDVAEVHPVTQKILEQYAFKALGLHIAISYIANTISKCEVKVYQNGKEVKDKLYYKLNVSPNPNQNGSQFFNKIIEDYFYKGRALVVPYGENIYTVDSFDIDDTDYLKGNEYYNLRIHNQTLEKRYSANDIFHFELDNINVKHLVDGLYAIYSEVIGQAVSTYKRSNGSKYKLKLEQYKAGDKLFEKHYNEVLAEQLSTFIKNDNAVYPEFKGTELQEFAQKTVKDVSDVVNMRKEIFEVIAQAFKIPLSMMLGNITNMNEIVKVYLSICIDPLADMMSEEFTRKYFTMQEWQNGCKIMIDTSCINNVDILEVADQVDKAISSGVTTIDELRERIGKETLNTDFSNAHFMTKNYALAEDLLNNNLEGEGNHEDS